ncbi:helix-turn-helix domain-containing protein [Prauserella muralis]|uniref:Transcriptional regulator n=1 Tax=Prauserella muralis TaxID=588067 RepID=A0A2V4B9Z7_9PSEU|nr:helix-turn-helix domain-containing protein [Prauserella muralis]PXY31881.1 transcriptional regulator [Prauserella muralis]TWE13702.1 helix-turn-helix protein [Prauserella muralis]
MDGRMDARRLYDALDAQRRARGMSWRQLADESGVSPSLLSRMGNGHRPDLDGFIALVQWLGAPAEDFMVWPSEGPREREGPALETQLAMLLRAREELSEADKQYLLDILGATMRRIKADRREN